MEIKVRDSYDIIVVGGGIAGISAAVAASRLGKQVLLIEKSVNLGGLATNGLISWYEPLCDGKGQQMVYGIAEELIRLSVKYCFDSLPEFWGGSVSGDGRFATLFSPTVFSVALEDFVLKNQVKIRFDTWVSEPVMEGKHCKGLICESVGGREFFGAREIIDASGNAVVCKRAGIPTVLGENYMSYVAQYYDREALEQYRNDENTAKLRKWYCFGSDLAGNGHPQELGKLKCETGDDVTEYMIYAKKKMFEWIKKKERNSFDIMTLPSMPQYRTICRIIGAEDFRAEDGVEVNRPIGSCGDFRWEGRGKHYQIPYGALYHPGYDNILACGRIISAPAGDGWEVTRVIPNCALTGEAAGKAAATAIDQEISVEFVGK